MSDLISRADAMAYPISWENYDKSHGDTKFVCGVESYREYIEYLPSAQPKQGEWVRLYDNIWICNNCEQAEQFGENIESTSNYCPNCGAKMEKEG